MAKNLFTYRPSKTTLFVLLLVLLVAGGIALRFLTPASTQVEETVVLTPSFIPQGNQLHPVVITNNISEPVSQKEVRVFAAVQPNQEVFTESIRTTLGLKQQQLIQNSYESEDRQISLTATGDPSILHYFDNTKISEFPSNISREQAITFATDFLTRLQFPLQNIDLNNPIISFQSGEEEDTSGSAQTIAVLQYQMRADGIPVSVSTKTPLVVVLFVSNKGVLKAYLPAPLVQSSQIQNTNTLSENDVLANIRQGKFAVSGVNISSFQPSDIKNLTIKSQTLEYRFDEENSVLIPFISILGETVINNETFFVSVITPAIKTVD